MRNPLVILALQFLGAVAFLVTLLLLVTSSLPDPAPSSEGALSKPVKSFTELLPPSNHWYADACGKGECDD